MPLAIDDVTKLGSSTIFLSFKIVFEKCLFFTKTPGSQKIPTKTLKKSKEAKNTECVNDTPALATFKSGYSYNQTTVEV